MVQRVKQTLNFHASYPAINDRYVQPDIVLVDWQFLDHERIHIVRMTARKATFDSSPYRHVSGERFALSAGFTS